MENTLKSLSISSFGWNLTGSIIRYGAAFVIGIVLARLLGPEPFGLVSIAMMVISIGNLIVDSGLNAGMVQKKDIEQEDIKFVFTIQMLLGVGIYLLIAFSAKSIAILFHQPQVGLILRTLSLSIILQAASQTSLGILKREMSFNKLQLAQLIAYLIGYFLIGIPLALANKGVWSLVIAQLSQSAINLILVYSCVRHPIGFNLHEKQGITKFGVKILGTNIANWIISSLDTMVIGRYYGSINLGLYNEAISLAFTPVGIVVTASQTVLFSISSRLQDSSETVKKSFLKIFNLFSEILVPASICLSITAGSIIEILYGSKWNAAIPYMRILSIALPFYALMAIEGPILAGMGKPEVELQIQWIVVIFAGICLFAAAHFTMIYVIWAVFLIYVIRFILLTTGIFKTAKISIKELMKVGIKCFTLAIITCLTVYLLNMFPYPSILIKLFIQTILGILSWIIVILIGNQHFVSFELLKSIIKYFSEEFIIKRKMISSSVFVEFGRKR